MNGRLGERERCRVCGPCDDNGLTVGCTCLAACPHPGCTGLRPEGFGPGGNPGALSEGFCPVCLIPLDGHYCRECKAWWFLNPEYEPPR